MKKLFGISAIVMFSYFAAQGAGKSVLPGSYRTDGASCVDASGGLQAHGTQLGNPLECCSDGNWYYEADVVCPPTSNQSAEAQPVNQDPGNQTIYQGTECDQDLPGDANDPYGISSLPGFHQIFGSQANYRMVYFCCCSGGDCNIQDGCEGHVASPSSCQDSFESSGFPDVIRVHDSSAVGYCSLMRK